MKALLYKEFKLAMHPVCYCFIILFPLMILIPSYPLGVGFIYVLTIYPVLFLGANKGQQSNDLLYSVLQPVRKKDVVLARIITVLVCQTVFIALMSALYPLARVINSYIVESAINSGKEPPYIPGFSHDGYVSVLSFAIVGFALADLVYFSIYYRKGRSIVASTIFTILAFAVYILFTTLVIPYIPGCSGYQDFFCNQGLGIQFAALGIALVLSAVLHYVVYKVASKELEKVDF